MWFTWNWARKTPRRSAPKWTLTLLARVSTGINFARGSLSSNSSFFFALHSLIPWVRWCPLLFFSPISLYLTIALVRLSIRFAPLHFLPDHFCFPNLRLSFQPSTQSLYYSTTANYHCYLLCLHLFFVDRSMLGRHFFQNGEKFPILWKTVFFSLSRHKENNFGDTFCWTVPRGK